MQRSSPEGSLVREVDDTLTIASHMEVTEIGIEHSKNTQRQEHKDSENKVLVTPRTTIKHSQRGTIPVQRIQGTHQLSTIAQDHSQQIYPNLSLAFRHLSDVEVLARRLTGTCIRSCVNYSSAPCS